MIFVGDRGVMRCCAVWLIGPLSQDIRTVVSGSQYAAIRFDQSLYRHSLSVDRAIGQSRVRYRPVLDGGLSEETCVPSRAETRASIAQNLEGGSEGARDRVVTGLHLFIV